MEETQPPARYRHDRTPDLRQRPDPRLLLAGPDRRAAPTEDQRRRTIRRLSAPHRPGLGACRSRPWRGTRRRTPTGPASCTRRGATSSSTSARRARLRRSTTVPADGSQLDPSTARNYEVGHRWQGWNGRVDTSLAASITSFETTSTSSESVTTFLQVGEQTSRGLDLDVNTDLGGQTHLILNYGFARPRFDDADDLTGKTPRFVPRHNVNVWLRKDWASGFNASHRRAVSGRAVRQRQQHGAARRIYDRRREPWGIAPTAGSGC